MEERDIKEIRKESRERIARNEAIRKAKEAGEEVVGESENERARKEFLAGMIGKRGEGKVRNSWGVWNLAKEMQARGWKDVGKTMMPGTVMKVVRAVNDIVAEEIAKGEDVVLPYRMGRIELRKGWRGAWIADGKLKISYPVDWSRTLKLWMEDKEAERDRTLIRFDGDEMYRLIWNKSRAKFENKHFYKMKFNRFLRQRLSQNIKNGKADALRKKRSIKEAYKQKYSKYGKGTGIREHQQDIG